MPYSSVSQPKFVLVTVHLALFFDVREDKVHCQDLTLCDFYSQLHVYLTKVFDDYDGKYWCLVHWNFVSFLAFAYNMISCNLSLVNLLYLWDSAVMVECLMIASIDKNKL